MFFFDGLRADIRFSYTNKEPDENKTVANSTWGIPWQIDQAIRHSEKSQSSNIS